MPDIMWVEAERFNQNGTGRFFVKMEMARIRHEIENHTIHQRRHRVGRVGQSSGRHNRRTVSPQKKISRHFVFPEKCNSFVLSRWRNNSLTFSSATEFVARPAPPPAPSGFKNGKPDNNRLPRQINFLFDNH
jgi:hypothetical protein